MIFFLTRVFHLAGTEVAVPQGQITFSYWVRGFLNRWCQVSRIVKGSFLRSGVFVRRGFQSRMGSDATDPQAVARDVPRPSSPIHAKPLRSGPDPPRGTAARDPPAQAPRRLWLGFVNLTEPPHPTPQVIYLERNCVFQGFGGLSKKKGKRGILSDICFGPSQVALSGSAIQLYNVPSLWRIVKWDGIWRCSPTAVLHRPRSPQISPTVSLTSPLTPWRPGFGFSPIVILYYYLRLQLMFLMLILKFIFLHLGVFVCDTSGCSSDMSIPLQSIRY